MRLLRRPAPLAAGAAFALASAEDEARRAGHGQVETDDVLAALAIDGIGTAGRALRSLGVTADDLRNGRIDADALRTIGIDLDEVRRSVEESFGPGALERAGAARCRRLALSAGVRDAIERASDEARASGSAAVDTEHLLLALAGAPALARRGVTAEDVREAVVDELEG